MKKILLTLFIIPLLFSCNDMKKAFLLEISKEVNKDCPMFIDEGITLINTTTLDDFIVYNIEMDTENYEFQWQAKDFDFNEWRDEEINIYCTDPDFEEFRYFGVGVVRNYKDKNGTVIQTNKVSKSDC